MKIRTTTVLEEGSDDDIMTLLTCHKMSGAKKKSEITFIRKGKVNSGKKTLSLHIDSAKLMEYDSDNKNLFRKPSGINNWENIIEVIIDENIKKIELTRVSGQKIVMDSNGHVLAGSDDPIEVMKIY